LLAGAVVRRLRSRDASKKALDAEVLVADAWDVEVQRRIAEVKAGKAKLVSWAEVSERLEGRLKKPLRVARAD
jgi:hypothetical protein